MMIARLHTRFDLRVALIGLLLAVLAIAALGLGTGTASAADTAAGFRDGPAIDRSGEEESEDPFHVSDESLTVAIIIPGIFVLATATTVAIAMSKRNRGDDEDDA